MKNNYHTHTARCMHAVGQDEDYVLAAIRGGFDTLGFADHMPWPFASGFVSDIRMPLSDLPGYMASVQDLKEKYRGQLNIRMGLESEYFPRYLDHMKRLRDMGIEYFILGHHYNDSEEENPYVGLECRTDDGVRRYADCAARAMQSGMFCYLAHPDLFMRHRTADQFNRCCEEAADTICQAALEMQLPIEYNLLGLHLQRIGKDRGYPCAPFWEYAKKYGNTVILGVDAHDPKLLEDRSLWDDGKAAVLGMGYRLIEELP